MSKEVLPDEAIEQVACDEMQQDWDRLEYQKVYHDGFVDGAKYARNKVLSRKPDTKLQIAIDALETIESADFYDDPGYNEIAREALKKIKMSL